MGTCCTFDHYPIHNHMYLLMSFFIIIIFLNNRVSEIITTYNDCSITIEPKNQ